MRNIKDEIKLIAVRAAKTFIQTFLAVITLSYDGLIYAFVAGIIAGIFSVVMGLIKELPESKQQKVIEEVKKLSEEYGFDLPDGID